MAVSIQQQINWATGMLQAISSSPRLDSEILLAHCLDKNRSFLMTWPEYILQARQVECFADLVQRRLQLQPIAYLVGSREFYSIELKTTADTLVPRPETEMLVDKVLEIVGSLEQPRILELGTGTGAIALAIKRHKEDSQIVATDISLSALAIARDNAHTYNLEVDFIQSDWFQSLDTLKTFDVVVSNPPYIAADDPYLKQGDLPAEPSQALCSGPSGLEALDPIIKGSQQYLRHSGWIVLEHGYQQGQAVRQLLDENGYAQVTLFQDFNSLDRMTVAQKPPA